MSVIGEQGLVYYVLDATRLVQYLKIGFTTNLSRRLVDLKGITSSGQVPLVLGLEEGSPQVEAGRHAQFSNLRSHGEWFHLAGDLVDFMKQLEHPFAYLLDRPRLWRFAGGWGPLAAAAAGQVSYYLVPVDLTEIVGPPAEEPAF